MHILITSGGTSEAIDSVRSITNHSTGKLGKILAETALAMGHQVTLITTPTALKPDPHPQLRLLLIQNVEELLAQMKTEVPHHQVLIHAMAVSDYTPVYMTGLEEVEKAQDLHSFIHRENQEAKNFFQRRIPGTLSKEKSQDYLARQRMEPCYSTDWL